MKTLQLYLLAIIIALICTVVFGSISQSHSTSEGAYHVMEVASADNNAFQGFQDQSAQQGISVNNLWALSEQAGPLRWPIFAVFLLGMFLVFYKLYELLADARESREIEDMEFRLMNVPQLIRAISGQRESMISRLHANMLNVFQSQQMQADLHDEISNYVQYQQDRFDTFKRRIEFLSDTAGALGLLGTVWGIFAVFSQGLLDDQIILTGMGVALISTLLGLVVSIILNLSSTEIFSLFNKRLDRIAEKSDELRFRLLELTAGHEDMSQEESFMPEFAPSAMVPAIKETNPHEPADADDTHQNHNNVIGQLEAKPIAQVEAVFEDRFTNNSFGDSAATTVRKPLVESSVKYPAKPHDLSLISPLEDSIVGKKIRDLCFLLVDENGEPVTECEVKLEIIEGGSVLNGEEQQNTLATDENGEVRFDIYVAKRVGKQVLSASVVDSDAPSTKITHSFYAKSGVPRKLKQFGNNQGGAAGEILSKALKVQVLDEFENPIPDWMVTFKVDLGGGAFDNNEMEVKVKTNLNGEGIAFLRVGQEPGFNTVRAAVEGVVKELKFQAMSMA